MAKQKKMYAEDDIRIIVKGRQNLLRDYYDLTTELRTSWSWRERQIPIRLMAIIEKELGKDLCKDFISQQDLADQTSRIVAFEDKREKRQQKVSLKAMAICTAVSFVLFTTTFFLLKLLGS